MLPSPITARPDRTRRGFASTTCICWFVFSQQSARACRQQDVQSGEFGDSSKRRVRHRDCPVSFARPSLPELLPELKTAGRVRGLPRSPVNVLRLSGPRSSRIYSTHRRTAIVPLFVARRQERMKSSLKWLTEIQSMYSSGASEDRTVRHEQDLGKAFRGWDWRKAE